MANTDHTKESILTSVKKMLGIQEDYEHFDPEIIMHINSAFLILNQLGVGPDRPFMIESKMDFWDDFLPEGDIELVKTYVYQRVRLMFDPPSSSFVLDSINKQIAEFEFRMSVQAEKDLLYPADMGGIYVSD